MVLCVNIGKLILYKITLHWCFNYLTQKKIDGSTLWHKKWHVQPKKFISINDEIDKLKLVNFIHLIIYTPCVLNPISFNNNQRNDTSHTNIHELNQTTTPNIIQLRFIDWVIDGCVGHEFFSFIGYNHIKIHKEC